MPSNSQQGEMKKDAALSHKPVLLREIIDIFDPKPGQIFIDATINGGGHARAILKKIGTKGKLLGIDLDQEIINKLADNLKPKNPKLELVCDNYANIKSIASAHGLEKADGILYDLGFSSYHIEQSGRGFSLKRDEPLDMRYNPELIRTSARDLVNSADQDELERIIREYGEERFARKIAEGIVKSRKYKEIQTTSELVSIINRSLPYWHRGSKKYNHSATKTFQAIRIAVNNELENLKQALSDSFSVLSPQGKIAVISFHSLEDRIVKNFFSEKYIAGESKSLTKKPIVPSWGEIEGNPRARSAKLRAAQKK